MLTTLLDAQRVIVDYIGDVISALTIQLCILIMNCVYKRLLVLRSRIDGLVVVWRLLLLLLMSLLQCALLLLLLLLDLMLDWRAELGWRCGVVVIVRYY